SDLALKIDPDSAEAWATKGSILNDQGKYSEAIAACDQALKIDTDNANAWATKGSVLNNQGKYSEAIAACDQALKIDPTNDDAKKERDRAQSKLKS
ncbi:tetratricopeptide repeat protein, partial [Methanoregula sp.]|uniref:tetratricopeptide repeat protein n=1 Tax=Methanoregula sp. TaxID=2052170 RepID=UPI00356192C1